MSSFRAFANLTATAAAILLAAGALAAATPSGYQAELAAARAAMAKHQYGKARSDYARAAELPGSDSVLCYMGMAEADAMRAKFSGSIKDCGRAERAAHSAARRAAALQLAGSVELRRGAYHQAAAVRRASLNQHLPDVPEKHIRAWLAQGERDYRAAEALAPNSAVLRFDLAVCLAREGQTAAADRQFRASLRLAPNGPAAAMARTDLADPDAALAYHAPEFRLRTDSGARLSTRGLEGKVVLLDFWGSWCPPCRETVGELRQIWKRYGRRGDFVILSIDSQEKRPAGQKFIAAHHMVWPQFWDGHAALEKAFGVHDYPTFILLDRQGVIRGWWTGEYGWRTGGFLDSVVQRWLRRKAG